MNEAPTLAGERTHLGRRHLLETLVAAGAALSLGLRANRPATAASLLRRIDVASSTQLAAALESAIPGHDIVLAGGSYVGEFMLNASGAVEHPIVLRSAAPQAAELRGKLTLNGAYTIVYQLAIGIGTKIEAHTGSITTQPSGTTGGAGRAASVPVPAYFVLQPSDVGPNAGL